MRFRNRTVYALRFDLLCQLGRWGLMVDSTKLYKMNISSVADFMPCGFSDRSRSKIIE